MDKVLSAPLAQAFRGAKIPWATFLFLTAVFFIAQHDWYFSLKGLEGFTVDDFTTLIDQGNLWRRLVFLSLGLFAVVSIFSKGHYRVKINGALGWLILFLLSWTFLSLAWSEDPAMTFRRLVLFALFSLGAFAVSQDFSLRQLVLWVFFSCTVYLNIGLLAELALGTFQPLAGGYRFAGTTHPNGQGLNCALLFFASLSLLATERRWRGVFGAIALESLIFLFLTKSRTSFFFAIIAPLFFWGLTWPGKRRFVVLLWIAALSCLLLLLGDYLFPAFQDALTLGRKDSDALTLTGRIPLWGEVLSYIAKRPLLGYGYDCFWTSKHVAEIAADQAWTITAAHSAYLELALGLGLIGSITYILIAVMGIGRAVVAYKPSANPYFGFIGSALIFLALTGLLESIPVMPTHVVFIGMVAWAGLGISQENETGAILQTVDISVNLCAYSRLEMPRQTLNSLLRLETGGAFSYEIVVIDDDSTDVTPLSVREKAKSVMGPFNKLLLMNDLIKRRVTFEQYISKTD
jgi:exopolysaccharide production protein ExoQ